MLKHEKRSLNWISNIYSVDRSISIPSKRIINENQLLMSAWTLNLSVDITLLVLLPVVHSMLCLWLTGNLKTTTVRRPGSSTTGTGRCASLQALSAWALNLSGDPYSFYTPRPARSICTCVHKYVHTSSSILGCK